MRSLFTILVLLVTAVCSLPAFAQESDTDEPAPTESESVDESDDGLVESVDDEAVDDEAAETEVFSSDDEFFVDDPLRERANTPARPMESMSEAELREAGFVFSDRDRSDLGSTGTILALTVGSAVHGVGHLYVGDTATGLFLLGMEGVSILSIMGSAAYILATGNADGGVAFSSSLFKLGVAGFFASWILDILGTLQGDELVFPVNRGPELGMHATIGYRLVDVDGTPMNHGFDAAIEFDNDFAQIGAGTTQDVLLKLQQYRGLVGTRPFVAPSRLTWLGADIRGAYTRYTGFGEFAQLDLDARLNFSVGMLAVSTSFDQISLGGSVGWGQRYLQVPDTENTLVTGDGRGRLIFDLHGELGVTQRLSSRVGYRNADGIIFPAQSPFIGITYVDLVYRSAGFGDLVLGAAFGDGLMLTAGGRLWLWR